MIRSRLRSLVLLLSLGLNLLLLSGIGYRLMTRPDFSEARPLPPNLGWIVRDLEPSRRRQLGSQLLESARSIRPLRTDMIAAQRRVNRLMAAENFDSERLRQAFAELRTAADRYQALSHAQTVLILEQLTPAERQAAREFVRRRGPRDERRSGSGGTIPRPQPIDN